MSKARASIFEQTDKLDLESFTPRTGVDPTAPPPQHVRAVTEAAQFRSREQTVTKPEGKPRRAARQYRTGRNVQFNVKALKETVDAFYAITDSQRWVLGYTLQRAVEALQRELKKPT